MEVAAAVEERHEFAARLRACLVDAGCSPDSPTVLMTHFNRRYDGPPMSLHGVRRWLIGQTIPTQEKLRVLAEWFDVPADWLRFGGAPTPVAYLSQRAGADEQALSGTDRALLANFRCLDQQHQESVLLLLQSLAKASGQTQPLSGYRKAYAK